MSKRIEGVVGQRVIPSEQDAPRAQLTLRGVRFGSRTRKARIEQFRSAPLQTADSDDAHDYFGDGPGVDKRTGGLLSDVERVPYRA